MSGLRNETIIHGKGNLSRIINRRSNSDAIFETERKWWMGACGDRIAGYHSFTMNNAPHLPNFNRNEEDYDCCITNECVFCTDPDEERELPLTWGETIKNMKLI